MPTPTASGLLGAQNLIESLAESAGSSPPETSADGLEVLVKHWREQVRLIVHLAHETAWRVVEWRKSVLDGTLPYRQVDDTACLRKIEVVALGADAFRLLCPLDRDAFADNDMKRLRDLSTGVRGEINEWRSPRTPAERFQALVQAWRSETQFLSLMSKITAHPAYQEIITEARSNPDVWLRLILQDLAERPAPWYTALKAITETSPVTPDQRGRLDQIREAWLVWGRERNLI